MKKNMSSVDRIVRVLIVAVLASLYFGKVISGTLGLILLVVAVVLLLTSIIGVCPAYLLAGISTRRKKQ